MIQELTVQLFNEDFGSLTLESEPRGLDQFTITRKRGESDGFIYEFSINLEFNREAGRFISAVYNNEGVDGIISINIYSRNPNTYKFDIEYQGQLQLDNYTQTETTISTNVEPIGFQRKFLNLQEYNVSLDGTQSRLGTNIGAATQTTLPLAPKVIREQAVLNGPTGRIGSGFTPNFYSYIRFGGTDITSDFNQANLNIDTWVSPNDVNQNVITDDDFTLFVEQGGPYSFVFSQINFDLQIDVGTIGGLANLDSWTVQLKFQRTGSSEITLFDLTLNGPPSDQPTGTGDFDEREVLSADRLRFTKRNLSPSSGGVFATLDAGDKVFVWFESNVNFIGPGTDSKNVSYNLREGSRFTISGNTTFPETNCTGYLVYEYLEHIVRTITDQEDVFRSEFFGRTDTSTVYAQDGEGSLLFITNGNFIRQTDNRSLFANWQDAFDSLNAIYCLGWGFETLANGQQVLRCEPKSYFYDKNTTALEVTELEQLEFFVDTSLLYSNVVVGYPELESIDQINGVDEFNTERTFVSPLTNVSQELDIRSQFRASGFEIENQRRLIESTNDSQLDDETFVIVVKRSGGGFVVEQGNDFQNVTNVFDPDSAYNLRITPARNFRRWANILSSSILRSSNKTFAFTAGEGNYLVSSTLPGEQPVAENGDVTFTNSQALFFPEKYRMTIKYPRSSRTIVDNNIRGLFKSNDWAGGDFQGFFTEIQANIPNRSAQITILRAFTG